MSESLRDIIEKVIIKEENIETDNVVYSELISLKEQIKDKIEELKETGNFEDEIEEAEIALEDEETTYDELIIVLENLEEL
ncbi:hypothetical protein [Leptotrichia shahii]|uniref:hypothetical protein n=1 Tax=Leptotrichia shahii TaxID=157691 RepID=UPI0028D4C86C|nr:hypothetical protein [Leptotrichia shahii]